MRLRMVGCNHRVAPIAVRERLAFSPDQTRRALTLFHERFADVEWVILSTCNRVEIYAASETDAVPTFEEQAGLLAAFHGMKAGEVAAYLDQGEGVGAVGHLFTVAAGLDSMVLGEPQILAQVKQAYQLAIDVGVAGPITHAAFQTAVKVARRIATETAIQHRRVSIPSVAVAEFARQIFERFDDKRVLLVGAGKMAGETLRYLRDEGASDFTLVNRSFARAEQLARQWNGHALSWDQLAAQLALADLVVSTTGAEQPVVTLPLYESIERRRGEKPLFVLDLAVPRDFDPAIGNRPGVYLYSIDDLKAACQSNRRARDKELPAAHRIIEQETDRFMTDLHHRATGPVILRLQQGWEKPKEEEIERLFHRLPELDEHAREEIRQSFDRLLKKLLHPPLDSLRAESRNGAPHGLLDALVRLFQLKE